MTAVPDYAVWYHDKAASTAWHWTHETHSHLGQMQVRCAGFEGLERCGRHGRPA